MANMTQHSVTLTSWNAQSGVASYTIDGLPAEYQTTLTTAQQATNQSAIDAIVNAASAVLDAQAAAAASQLSSLDTYVGSVITHS